MQKFDSQDSQADGKWQAAARQRNCYCGLWDTKPEIYIEQGLSEGYCGTCQRCGEPGHARHFPGPVPYTGAWCDRCYRIVGLTWPFRTLAGWIRIIVVTGAIAIIAVQLYPLIAAAIR